MKKSRSRCQKSMVTSLKWQIETSGILLVSILELLFFYLDFYDIVRLPMTVTLLLYNSRCLGSNTASYAGFPRLAFKFRIYVFWSKLTIKMLTVRGKQHSFSTHERVFLGKCQSLWDRKCLDLRGTRTPNLPIRAECSNLLSYQGQTFAVPWCWILALAV